MKIIESVTYEKFTLGDGLEYTDMYIFVPITLLIMQAGERTRTHFIFWN